MALTPKDAARFAALVVTVESGCMEWRGPTDLKGYGRFRRGSGSVLAHRIAYEMRHGPGSLPEHRAPDWPQLDHLCRNRRCVNVDHLEVVTQRENQLRGQGVTAEHAGKTECPRGHPYEGDNLVVDGGRRRCRACRREQGRAAQRRHRQRGAGA